MALALSCLAGPVHADPAGSQMVIPDVGRQIADPANLAPPRVRPPEATDSAPADLISLDLNGAISMVLEKSPGLERVMARIRQADYGIEEAYTLANPTVNFSAQYSRVDPGVTIPGIGPVSPENNYQFALNIRQAIYTFGRLKWSTLAAKLAKRAAEEEYRTEINRLVQLTAERYIQALLAQDAVTIALDNLEAQQANLRTSQLLYDQGVAARFDVLSNSAAVAQAEQRVIEARTAERNAKARILSLLDEPLNSPLRLAELNLHAPGEIALPEARMRALEGRPDLRSLRWAVEEAKARVEVAETSNNPMLELQNTTINRNAAGLAPGTQNTMAVVLSVPLFDGGVSHYQKEQALEAVAQLNANLEQSERDVVLQVEEVYNQLRDRWAAIAVAEENVKQADEALRVAVLRYQNGISTNTELLDTQARRSQARFELVEKRALYLLSRWAWWQATASEYPTQVPFPAYLEERLSREGIPLRPTTLEFDLTPSNESIGPLEPTSEPPQLPIRGLPGSGVQETPTSEASPAEPSGTPQPDGATDPR